MARERRTPAERQGEAAAPAVDRGVASDVYVRSVEVGYLADPTAPHDGRDYSLPGQAAAAKADE
jgi:hypothetical protein